MVKWPISIFITNSAALNQTDLILKMFLLATVLDALYFVSL